MLNFARARDFFRDQFDNVRAQFDVRAQIEKIKKDFNEAAPAIRDLLPAGLAVLAKEESNEQIGVLVFELYELKLAEITRGRTPTDADKIAAFKSVRIPIVYPDSTTEQNRKERLRVEGIIRQEIEKEYNACYERGDPIPPAISKLQADYYLRDLHAAGLKAVEVNGIKPNVDTGRLSDRAKMQEKIAHYVAQWASWSITLSLAFATAMTVGLWSAPFVFAITYFARKSGNDFGMYDVAEALLRDAGWALSKKLGWEGKIDRSKALKTLGYGIAIVATSVLAVNAAWVGTLLLPGWGLLSFVLPSAIMNALQVGVAGYFAAIAGIATLAGCIATTRFFCTLSLFDNQIPFAAANANEFVAIGTQDAPDNKYSIAAKLDRLLDNATRLEGADLLSLRQRADSLITRAFNLRPQQQPQNEHDQDAAAAAEGTNNQTRRRPSIR